MAARRYDRTTREAAAQHTQRRIIDATVALHAEHGAMGTTHEMIARRAGVSLPTVYKYFPTRNDLIPHCTGQVMGQAAALDDRLFEGHAEVPARLRALTKGVFALYDHAAPWLRWSARDAGELPALQAVLEQVARGRESLVRAALAPGRPASAPRRLVALAGILLDFPAWQSLRAAGLTSAGAATAVADALVTLHSTSRKENA